MEQIYFILQMSYPVGKPTKKRPEEESSLSRTVTVVKLHIKKPQKQTKKIISNQDTDDQSVVSAQLFCQLPHFNVNVIQTILPIVKN